MFPLRTSGNIVEYLYISDSSTVDYLHPLLSYGDSVARVKYATHRHEAVSLGPLVSCMHPIAGICTVTLQNRVGALRAMSVTNRPALLQICV